MGWGEASWEDGRGTGGGQGHSMQELVVHGAMWVI